MDQSSQAAAIRAIAAERLDGGFRLLVLRQYHAGTAPPAFAFIEQKLLRAPHRFSRHGAFFATTFLPDVMSWLIEYLGRPSLRDAAGEPRRNPRWPAMKWHGEERRWPDGTHTTEWFADITFHDDSSWTAFQARWRERLGGRIESDGSPCVDRA